MLKLETRPDLEALHSNQVAETNSLEYKASAAIGNTDRIKAEIAKDISAMANASGGQIIYGMTEENHRPAGLDGGVPEPFNGLWFEQVIQQNIKPIVEGLKIQPVPAGGGRNYFVITVPASKTVHQAADRRYYRRRNFRNDTMEDYEIREAMNRAINPEPYVEVILSDPTISWSPEDTRSRPIPIGLRVGNRSSTPALYTYISVFFDSELVILSGGADAVSEAKTSDGKKIQQLHFHNVVPTQFPIFKEKMFRLGKGTTIAIPGPHKLNNMLYRIGVEISTPGYHTLSTGHLMKLGATLELRWEPWID